MKECKAVVSKKQAQRFFNRKELENLVAIKLKLPMKEIKKLNKKKLCNLLNVKWVLPKKKTIKIISTEKVCTDRNCKKTFPNRYSKAKLVEMAKLKFPNLSKSKLNMLKMPTLCSKLKIKYVKCPPSQKLLQHKKKISKLLFQNTRVQGGCVFRSALKLQPQQLKIIEYMQTHRGILIYHTVGSGKTLTAITLSQCYLDANPNNTVIVVCPASLIANFQKQMYYYKNIKHANNYKFYSIQSFVNAKKKGDINCANSMLIIDEAHNLKTAYSKNKSQKTGKVIEKGVNSKHVINCAEKADKVVLLSATPVVNDMKDLVSLYNMIRNTEEPRMTNTKKTTGLHSIPYSTEELIQRLRCKVSFFDAVDKNFFPESKEHDIFLRMSPSFEKKYNELLGDKGLSKLAISHFGDTDIQKFYNGFRRAVNTLEGPDSPKIKWVVKQIQEAKPNEKIIVFSHFLDSGNFAILKALSPELQKRSAYIRGSVTKKKRSEIVNKYNKNELQFLFISKAGGEGLDLKETRKIIILEPSWNRSLEEQVIGRGVRYMSHSALPLKDRVVDIYRLYNIKHSDKKFQQFEQQQIQTQDKEPPKFDPVNNSVDMLMRYLQYYKERKLIYFRKRLINYSIENQICL
jgi:SNF2 family DNA or RNA helicase